MITPVYIEAHIVQLILGFVLALPFCFLFWDMTHNDEFQTWYNIRTFFTKKKKGCQCLIPNEQRDNLMRKFCRDCLRLIKN